MYFNKLAIIFLVITNLVFAQSSTKEAHWLQLPNVQKYIRAQAKSGNFSHHELSLYLSQASIKPKIIDIITHPYEAKPWPVYKKHFVNPHRISAGKRFIDNNKSILHKAEQKYQVPANIIVAILGVESNYGKIQSHYKTLDSLATLAFYYPKRQRFFQSELTEYLQLVKRYHWHPLQIGSSYAGAMGMPQFMPSSYRRFAVSSKADHYPDLFNNTNDAILSIANYLHHFKWQYQQPIVYKAALSKNSNLHKNNQWPVKTFGKNLKELGIITKNIKIKPNQPLVIWHLNNQNINTVWVAWPNLKTIMHYNRSPMYAISTALLAQSITKP